MTAPIQASRFGRVLKILDLLSFVQEPFLNREVFYSVKSVAGLNVPDILTVNIIEIKRQN